MSHKPLTTPVVFMVFNRPAPTRIVFDAIAAARPTKLLIVADGPRPDKPGEADLCRQVRSIVENVTWPCELRTNFAEGNLGCQERVISGLNWAFSQVEEAIVLEDDCVPDPSFFPFCQELLERYRGDQRIGMISGNNFAGDALHTEYSYFFSQMPHIWGWATWREVWNRYDRHLERWPEIKRANLLSELFDSPAAVRFWTVRFDEMHNDTGPNTWDYQWTYTNLINNALTIAPSVNLVTNIGFGADATHTTEPNSALTLESKSLAWPLKHPPSLLPLRSVDRNSQKHHLPPSFIPGKIRAVRRRFLKLLQNLKPSTP